MNSSDILNRKKQIIILTFFIFIGALTIFAQDKSPDYPEINNNNPVLWKFPTTNHIYASPIIHKQIIYIGSRDKNFYAIDAYTGIEKWRYTAPYPISSTAAISDSIVCFESGDQLIGLNIHTGRQVWRFNPGNNNPTFMLDPWDYYHSSPVIDNNTAYYGDEHGHIYGININTGELSFEHTTENGSPIRSTPAIYNNRVFFGDWEGVIYSVHLRTSNVMWQKSTFTGGRPYPSFGGITSKIIINNEILYYGGRNPKIYALNVDDGLINWLYSENTGGWLISTPSFDNRTLFIGGSDNFNLYALNAGSGNLSWTFNAGLNIFAKPLIADNNVLICTGNAYFPGTGNGSVYSIKKSTHNLETEYQAGGNIWSSPILYDGILYFGCNDNNLYALDSRYFGENPQPDIELLDLDLELADLDSDMEIYDTTFYIYNNGGLSDSIVIASDYNNPSGMDAILINQDSEKIYPGDSLPVKLIIFPKLMESGQHNFNILIDSRFNPEIKHFEIAVSLNISDKTGTGPGYPSVSDVVFDRVFPNPFSDIINFQYTLSKTSRVILQLFNLKGQQLAELINKIQPFGKQSVSWNGSNTSGYDLLSGIYLYQLKVDDYIRQGKIIFNK